MQFKHSKHAKLHFSLLVNETLLVLTTEAMILLAQPLSGCHSSYSFIPALPSLSGGAGPECWGVFPPACPPLVYHRPTWSEAQPPPHHLGTFPLQNLGRNPLWLSWEHHQCPPPTPGEIECALCKIAVNQAALRNADLGFLNCKLHVTTIWIVNDLTGVSIHWTGLLEWTTGLDYWTGLLDWTTGLAQTAILFQCSTEAHSACLLS